MLMWYLSQSEVDQSVLLIRNRVRTEGSFKTQTLTGNVYNNFTDNLKLATMNPLLKRISVDPQICFGKPCIKGHRIWVSLILGYLAAGDTIEDILNNYPQLSREDILACIAYGAAMSDENYVDIDKVAWKK